MAGAPLFIRHLILAAVTLLAVAGFGSSSYAQSGPFSGLAGYWSGAGTVTLDDGSTERIRCRASYAVGDNGAGLNQTLVCASDSYKFDLKTNVIAERRIAVRNLERKQPWRQRQHRRTRQQRQFPGRRQRAWIHRQHLADHAGQPAVGGDQVRERVPGCHDLADPLLRPVPAS